LTDRTTVEQLLAEARARVRRLSPKQADAAARAGALLIDIRSEAQRDRDRGSQARASSHATCSSGAATQPRRHATQKWYESQGGG
jgi:hypothetical protein